MVIYPAIDMLGGKCVRLTQGNYNNSVVYGDYPWVMAEKWVKKGAKYIHTVDLDGAKVGRPINIEAVKKIIESIDVPIQLGGGIRDEQDIENMLNLGVNRVILGTSAVNNKKLVIDSVKKYGDRIAVGIDAKDERVAISGWEKISDYNAVEFAKMMQDYGVSTIIYTDISTDGMLKGPNLKAMEKMSRAVNLNVIASGGVSCADDVKNLNNTGVSGVIIGKALYCGNLDLEEVLCLQNV